jgi:hypothetical protein
MTFHEIRDAINNVAEKIEEAMAALGTDLERDAEGFIADDSDLGVALRMMNNASSQLTRLSLRLGEEDPR